MNKDIVAGLGEIGLPILKLISKKEAAVGYDLNTQLMNSRKFKKFENMETRFLHIAIPVNKNFNSNVIELNNKFQPKCIILHSTISPGTTQQIQNKLKIPLIFSATRGVHKRMLKDLQMKMVPIIDDLPFDAMGSYTGVDYNYENLATGSGPRIMDARVSKITTRWREFDQLSQNVFSAFVDFELSTYRVH